jgi:hypothetical protein
MSNQKDNIAFWEEFQSTDPKFSKSNVKVSGQNRTTVDAQYKKKQITKAFGMFARGWGVDTHSEVFERVNYENSTVLLHYRAVAFYVIDGERFTFPIAASIKEVYVTNNGQGYMKIDEEAVKKVRTDALTKGFTDLGFCSDVHMGMFDDDNYVISQGAKIAIEQEEDQEEALIKAIEGIKEWVGKEIEACKKLLPKNENGFKAAMRGVRVKLVTRCQAVSIHPKQYTNRLDQIELQELAKLEETKQEQGNAS